MNLIGFLNCRVTAWLAVTRLGCLGAPNSDTSFDLGFGPHRFDPPCFDWPYDRPPKCNYDANGTMTLECYVLSRRKQLKTDGDSHVSPELATTLLRLLGCLPPISSDRDPIFPDRVFALVRQADREASISPENSGQRSLTPRSEAKKPARAAVWLRS
jgi:hypothetical protein